MHKRANNWFIQVCVQVLSRKEKMKDTKKKGIEETTKEKKKIV